MDIKEQLFAAFVKIGVRFVGIFEFGFLSFLSEHLLGLGVVNRVLTVAEGKESTERRVLHF